MIKTNNIVKVLAVMLLIAMVIMSLQPVVSADPSSIISDLDTKADASADTATSDELIDSAGKVIALIRNIAVIAGVIILTVLGVKYMMGSVEEKAEYKKSMMPLVIGIVVVMAATSIASFLFSIFE